MSNASLVDRTFVEPATERGNASNTATSFWLRFFPSLTDLAFLLPLVALFTFLEGVNTLLGDGDTGWHIRAGDWILQHGQVPHRDIFSFTKPDSDWFAWEWGWDVLFSLVHRYWSLSGVAFVNFAILGVIAVLLYRLVRRQAPNDAIAFILTGVALCASSLHWLARPHLLSWIFILAFLHLIEKTERGDRRALWWSPALMLLWVNVHGSFFVGIFFLLTFAFAHTVRDVVMQGRSPLQAISRHRIYFASLALCSAVTLINPYGWQLHEHVIRYLLDARQLNSISEFTSVDFHSPLAIRFELFLALGTLAAYRYLRAGQWAEAAMVVIWAHLGLKSARNIPIFVFIAAPGSAAFLRDALEQAYTNLGSSWLGRAAKAISSFGQDFANFERVERFPLLPVAALALLAAGLGILPLGIPLISDFNSKDFPVKAANMIAQQPGARVFTFDQWGDYLIYRFFPQRSAFSDGRSDFYGTDFVEKWVSTVRAQYDWQTELSRYSINTVLIKTDNALSSVLKESPEWKPVFDDGRAIVFRKLDSSGSPSSTRSQ